MGPWLIKSEVTYCVLLSNYDISHFTYCSKRGVLALYIYRWLLFISIRAIISFLWLEIYTCVQVYLNVLAHLCMHSLTNEKTLYLLYKSALGCSFLTHLCTWTLQQNKLFCFTSVYYGRFICDQAQRMQKSWLDLPFRKLVFSTYLCTATTLLLFIYGPIIGWAKCPKSELKI